MGQCVTVVGNKVDSPSVNVGIHTGKDGTNFFRLSLDLLNKWMLERSEEAYKYWIYRKSMCS